MRLVGPDLRTEKVYGYEMSPVEHEERECPRRVYHRILQGNGCCCCAVGMCENSRQRVILISIAVAAIFLGTQVACAVSGG